MLTLSVVRTNAFRRVHPTAFMAARAALHRPVASGLIIDGQVASCGADISLIMIHQRGVDAPSIHGLVQGSTGCAELEFTERPDEHVVCVFADRTSPGVWNLPLYRMFTDPLTITSAANGETMPGGFSFEVYDLYRHERIWLNTPAELRDLRILMGTPSRYVAHAVVSKTRSLTAATTSARQSHVGPVLIVRAQYGLPALAAIRRPFTVPGAPPMVALDFRVREGSLIGPRDMFSTDCAVTAMTAGA